MYNVLVVDDEPLICKGLCSLLASSGLAISQLFTAHNGYEAMDYLRMEDIDLLITDIQMGEMSGIQLMHQAKMIKPWLQAIVISAHETFQYAQLAIRLGAKDYLIKPLNGEQFLDAVRNVLLGVNKAVPPQDETLAGFREQFRLEQPTPERTALLNRLLAEPASAAETAERLQARFGTELSGPYYAVFRVRLGAASELLQYAALNVAMELLDQEWRPVAFYDGDDAVAVIVQWSDARYEENGTNKIDQLDMLGRSLHANIAKYLRVPCVVGISQILRGAAFLGELGAQAAKAVRWNEEHRELGVFYYGDFSWARYAQGQEPSEEEMAARNNLIVEKAKAYIDEHYAQKGLTLHEVAQKNHVSPNYLSYLFKKNTGHNLWEYVIKLRMEESRRLILRTDLRRYEIAERVGYESPEHFSKIFKKVYGVSPTELKK
ncbi:Two-component response regulator, YesN/AraC family, consists of REC and AraC-type DNA-binding domains [Paenibacillus sp. UNC496MF]|uniref:response regulator n=1 Tax=Paenibacillus sp. UNC496MF TaxID=1502753 RepID=UPI0008F1FF14|nr:response regulator [Paenibacillus sp. UNC496MF]SFJ49267.1 Two-component response regulator, YesN/AraC family, consists of REC and AraC-type DNA-binding domains [Paenibacillus sp. UNC496MF]